VIVTPPAELAVGKPITFELTVTNNSKKGASHIVVTDILERNIGDREVGLQTNTGHVSYDAVTKKISWEADTLPGEQSIKLKVIALLLGGKEVSNTATVRGADNDPDMSNNTATATTQINGADIFIPNAFTPNGDGQNDRFIILGLERYPGSSLIIFNRWGNVVYRSSDYRNTWDGSQLNEGTYYYELTCPVPSGAQKFKGWLQLVR